MFWIEWRAEIMNSKEMARRIVVGYLNGISSLGFEERVIEISSVNESDDVLLEHINIMIDVLGKAKEEIEKEKENES